MPFQTKNEQIVKLRTQVEHLRCHLKIERIQTSRAIKELVQFCNQGLAGDPLIFPVKENPFKEQKRCTLL